MRSGAGVFVDVGSGICCEVKVAVFILVVGGFGRRGVLVFSMYGAVKAPSGVTRENWAVGWVWLACAVLARLQEVKMHIPMINTTVVMVKFQKSRYKASLFIGTMLSELVRKWVGVETSAMARLYL